jgi:hypothetical protein
VNFILAHYLTVVGGEKLAKALLVDDMVEDVIVFLAYEHWVILVFLDEQVTDLFSDGEVFQDDPANPRELFLFV